MSPRVGDRPSATETFLVGISGQVPTEDQPFDELFGRMDHEVRQRFGNTRSLDQALNKIHGDWYEFLLAISAHNVHVRSRSEYIAIELPNKARYDCEKLYKPKYSEFISDLRSKVDVAAGVVLVSSNPDFVILRSELGLNSATYAEIREVDIGTLESLRSRYHDYNQQCDFEDIAGYLGAKFTLKPDRRLQLAHEGSLMKALYVHLQTREWKLSPPGIRYYAAATQASPADLHGLKTVATHSITSVTSEPQRAVDCVFIINSLREADQMFERIYTLSQMPPVERSGTLREPLVVINMHGRPLT